MIDRNPFYQLEHAFVRWDPEIQAVYSVVDGYLDDQEYMRMMEMVLELAVRNDAKRWLANNLKGRPLSVACRQWMVSHWAPMAKQIGLTKTAILMPESALTKISLERLLEKWKPLDLVETRFFSDLEKARIWLAHA